MDVSEAREQRLQNYLDAEKKALAAQSFKDGKVEIQRADIGSIRKGVDELLSGGDDSSGSRCRRVIMRDC